MRRRRRRRGLRAEEGEAARSFRVNDLGERVVSCKVANETEDRLFVRLAECDVPFRVRSGVMSPPIVLFLKVV